MRNAAWLLFLLVVSVQADPDADAVKLERALVRLRTAPAAKADEAVQAVLALTSDRAAVAARLAKPLPVASLGAGWHIRQAIDEKGTTRDFEMYVPKSLNGGPVPLLVHMHGGVARAEYYAQPGRRSTGGMWVEMADKHGFVLAFPYGRKDCMWWSEAGAANVRAVVREVKRLTPIDDDAVIGTGFSDGGSGSYYLALAEPGPFAAFIPMNGHFAVAASASREQLYLENLKGVPLFIAMTQDDSLYPAASMMPHIQKAMEVGALVKMVSYPRGGHRPVYFDEQKEVFAKFIMETAREPLPSSLQWRCANVRLGKMAWAEITAIGPFIIDNSVNVMDTEGRVRLGVGVDQAFEGTGVRIATVSKGSVAYVMGLAPGDVVVRLGDVSTDDLNGLRKALAAFRWGDKFQAHWMRGEKKFEVRSEFPAFTAKAVYARAKPTATLRVKSEGQRIVVEMHNAPSFRLWLSPVMFGEDPIALAVNGKRVEPVVKDLTLEQICGRYAIEADAGRVFTRVISVDVK